MYIFIHYYRNYYYPHHYHSAACFQAGAIFKVRSAWRDKYKIDYISEWLSEVTSVPLLGCAGFHRYHPEILQKMMENAHTFTANSMEEDEEELRKILNIDTEPWFTGKIKHDIDDKLLPLHSIPFPKMTHLILSDEINVVIDKIDRGIPTGMIVIHGGPGTTVKLCETIHKGNPIFLFKYTGGTADLACETISKIEQYLRKKRSHPNIRPEHPFGYSFIYYFYYCYYFCITITVSPLLLPLLFLEQVYPWTINMTDG